MQLKHFEHLANLERSIVKEQFQKAVKAPVLPFGPHRKQHASNKPQVTPLTSVAGKLGNPYGGPRIKLPTEKQIREQKGKTAALVANDGLTPGQGGALGLMNEQGAMLGTAGKPLRRPRPKTKTQVM